MIPIGFNLDVRAKIPARVGVGLRIQKQVVISKPDTETGAAVVEWQTMATIDAPLEKAIVTTLNAFGDETDCRILDVNTVVWPTKGDA